MRRVPLLFVLAVILAASSAWADNFGVSMGFTGNGGTWSPAAGVNNGYDIYGFGWGGTGVTDTGIHSLNPSTGNIGVGLSAQLVGQATFGALHGVSEVSASAYGDGNGYSKGIASTHENFWDSLTIVNPSGGDVLLRFTNLLNASLGTSLPQTDVACSSSDVGNLCAGAESRFVVTIGNAQYNLTYTITTAANSPSGSTQQSILVASGTTITFQGDLYTFAGSCAQQNTANLSPCVTDASGQPVQYGVDASNTAHFNIDVLTPGASYTTGSGYDYSTPRTSPVPEPSSLMLLGSGLAGIARLVRRRA